MAVTWKQLAYKDEVLPDLLSPYAVGDLLYASSTSALSKLADVATGQVLVSGGVGVAPAWSAAPYLTTSLTVPLIIAPAASLALRPTTDGTTAIQLQDKDGNSILNVDTTNNRVGIGNIAPDRVLTVTGSGSFSAGLVVYNSTMLYPYPGSFGIIGQDGDSSYMNLYAYRDGVSAGGFQLRHARGTEGSPTILSSGDTLGSIFFVGWDGATWRNAASIKAIVGGTPGSSDMPGHIIFQTTPDGSATLADRMLIDNAGNIGLGVTAFGTSAAKVMGIGSGTAPTTAPADMAQLWVEDVNGTAGYAGLHKMTETTAQKEVVPGVIIKTDTGSPANPYEGLMEINTFDNKIRMYGDAGWRELGTW